MANIKVAIRVRPISAREQNLTGAEVVVRTDHNEVSLTNLKVSSSKAGDSRERIKRYAFDYCFDSSDPDAANYADQAKVYKALGQSVLDALFSGYNSCLVAYGQSASGKTYTMMGSKDDPGLTPRLCEGLFARIEREETNKMNYRVSVSYLEIYNDRVRDLLKPSTSVGGLKVREHPRLGPYVQGLTHHVVRTLGSLMSYVDEGTKARKTASTLQNPSSSRSHALLTVALTPETASTQVNTLPTSSTSSSSSSSSSSQRNESAARAGSRLHLVDLAGSESAATCSGVHRLKEGANINKSLVALGNVISALAERGSTGSGPGRRFIPYRDSSLTWLLKDALGGNATTIMLATISPASGSYNETAHTLRFAQRAQSVVNRPVVNADPVQRIIRELREEIARLKSLLSEKDAETQNKSQCTCSESQPVENVKKIEPDEGKSLSDLEKLVGKENGEVKQEVDQSTQPIRKFNSTESLAAHDASPGSPIKKFGSLEFLNSTSRLIRCNYNRAKVSELNDEKDEIVNEISEPVFVDIPTLVAVLIKPDDSLQESTAQIEEICSDEVPEDSIDTEFIEVTDDPESFDNPEKPDSIDREDRSNSISSFHASGDIDVEDIPSPVDFPPRSPVNISKVREKGKFRKQDSIDISGISGSSSNLETLKRFGSVEGLQKKKESFVTLERSHTNLEKRPVGADKAKKLNNIREIEDQKIQGKFGNIWKGIGNSGSKDYLQRKGSNDSDKSLKDSNGLVNSKIKSTARKPSLENLKRKTSKDSSSSSSKEEQILISSLAREKLLRRKGSLDQESPVIRSHTPIQRAKRAEIVAAVTERLYSSRKPVEESAMASTPGSGTRSPPEGTDIKLTSSVFSTRSKLQEISRKMLAKRRRVCVDTQTENLHTVRMKDTASLTEEPKIICQDVGILTDHHENCESLSNSKTPVLRMKEISTLTDKPSVNIVRYKDAESLANDFDYYEYEIHSPRNDSGILSDDTQNYAESNLSSTETSDVCTETYRRVLCTESSTNTLSALLSPCRSFGCQTPRNDVIRPRQVVRCNRHCCNTIEEACQTVSPVPNSEKNFISEKNIISISLPDMINITIESPNAVESRIAMIDEVDSSETVVKSKLRDNESQTDQKSQADKEEISAISFKDLSIRSSQINQVDGRVFRIENIFDDPRLNSKVRASGDGIIIAEDDGARKSVIFTNSLGTSFVPETRECATEMDQIQMDQQIQESRTKPLTEVFIARRRSYCGNSNFEDWPESPIYGDPWQQFHSTMKSIEPRNILQQNANDLQIDEINKTTLLHAAVSTENISADSKNSKLESPELVLDKLTRNLLNANEPVDLKMDKKYMDQDYNFSDDSLDCNETSVPKNLKSGKKCQENICPPDVVAHTKKEKSESPVIDDFDDVSVELPKKSASTAKLSDRIHDYKSLILGEPVIHKNDKLDEQAELKIDRINGSTKKKVSFSNINFSEEKNQSTKLRNPIDPKKNSTELKSIIKNRKKKNILENKIAAQSSNDETDESCEDKEDQLPDEIYQKLFKRDISISHDFNLNPIEANSKKIKSKENRHSHSDDNGNFINGQENCSTEPKRNVLEEYLDEAVMFMRNVNSINEYMLATKMLDKYMNRGKRKGNRRKSQRSRDKNYIIYEGHKISLKDETDKYLKDDEDIIIPTDSYENCLKGIERLEKCIEKANKHNKYICEKYNIDIESADARQDLARFSSDSKDPIKFQGHQSPQKTEVPSKRFSNFSGISGDTSALDDVDSLTKLSNYTTINSDLNKSTTTQTVPDKKNSTTNEDLGKIIFDQLMNVVESRRCLKQRSERKDLDQETLTYCKLRGKYNPINSLDHRNLDLDDAIDHNIDINGSSTVFDCTEDFSLPKMSLNRERNFVIRKKRVDDVDLIDEDDLDLLSGFMVDPKMSKDTWQGSYEDDRSFRRIKDSESSKRSLSSSIETLTVGYPSTSDTVVNLDSMDSLESIDRCSYFRDKLKYPGSPRARFLELLNERRRIVESTRSTSAS